MCFVSKNPALFFENINVFSILILKFFDSKKKLSLSLNVLFTFVDFLLFVGTPGKSVSGVFVFIKKDCTIEIRINLNMGRLKFNKKEPFTFIERKGKDGKVTIIRHTANGFQTLSVSGKVKIPAGLSDSIVLSNSISSIGFEFLHLFPDFLDQKKKSAILTYTFPIKNDRQAALHYDFHYIKKGGSDIETALNETLSKINMINEGITACMKSDQVQSSSLADLPEKSP